jgi:succinylglutamate desuccinylase
MKTKNDKIIRLKYVRVLEKFVTKTISILKHPEFDLIIYKKQTNKNYKFIELTKSIRLDSQYLQKLQDFIQLILNTLDNHSKDFKLEQQLLLKEVNLLHKEKNKSNYKKEKYSKKKFIDGY